MAQIPTPPASRQTSESPEIQKETDVDTSAELLQTLDSLLERYLYLLDLHQRLQADLAKQLSSGFLSLAQANYTCPPGRRYGADYYDQRMKATRKVSLHPSETGTDESERSTEVNDPVYTFTIEHATDKHNEGEDTKDTSSESPSNAAPFDGNPEQEGKDTTPESDVTSTSEQPDTTTRKPKPIKKFRSSDPITWYGILVPPSLRSGQKSFTEAVDDHLPELASVVVEMRAVEKEVDEVRIRLDLSG